MNVTFSLADIRAFCFPLTSIMFDRPVLEETEEFLNCHEKNGCTGPFLVDLVIGPNFVEICDLTPGKDGSDAFAKILNFTSSE
ncbi:hypothetical protein RUM43_013122 [Polyplax serrata]|uniref:Uncharacterized protein n=1 Tax=Polyplax serrata TaxID=468196 RepID=A0AAN8P2Q9_POLSC